jgi:hypothetical protein
LNVYQNTPQAAAGGTPANAPTDTVALSPEAYQSASAPAPAVAEPEPTAGGQALDTASSETPATTESTSSSVDPASPSTDTPSPAPTATPASRADVLFDALDADSNGSITEEEFVDGARALLRSGRRHHHGDSEGDHDRVNGRGHGYGRHMGRRLERVFGRVDGDDDGALSRQELTQALAANGNNQPAASPVPHTSGDPAPASVTTITSVSVSISIAIRRYETIQQAPPTPNSTGTTTADSMTAVGTAATNSDENRTPAFSA